MIGFLLVTQVACAIIFLCACMTLLSLSFHYPMREVLFTYTMEEIDHLNKCVQGRR